MRRLYSTFAPGWPGLGLLLIRLVAGMALLVRSGSMLWGDTQTGNLAVSVLSSVCGVLLLSGLWTPVIGTLVAVVEAWQVLTRTEDLWVAVLLGSMGAALAMLGPGSWSADAHFFGWKRIESHLDKSISKSS